MGGWKNKEGIIWEKGHKNSHFYNIYILGKIEGP